MQVFVLEILSCLNLKLVLVARIHCIRRVRRYNDQKNIKCRMEAGCCKKKRENWHFNALLFHPWKCVEPNQLYNIHTYTHFDSVSFSLDPTINTEAHTHTHTRTNSSRYNLPSKIHTTHREKIKWISIRIIVALVIRSSYIQTHRHTQKRTHTHTSQKRSRGKKRTVRKEITKNENEIAIRPKIIKKSKTEKRKRVEWQHSWTVRVFKILMVRLHILQAIHGCRYSHSKTHAAPFLCVFFFFYAFFMPACVFFSVPPL